MDFNVPDEFIRQTLEEVIQIYLIPKFLSLGMNASGSWINSLSAEALDGAGYIKGKDYTYYLVNGRAPGNRPPVTPLISWVAQKLGKTGAEGKGIAFAIANKIAKEGTEYYPNGTDLLEVLQSPDVTNYIYTKLGGYMAGQIRVEIVRQLKSTLA